VPYSNYPGGFAHGVTIRGVPIHQAHPGEVFWVNNSTVFSPGGIAGSDDLNDGTYRKPFNTIEGALNKDAVTASRGDILMVMPGHSETITTDGGIALDKVGVAVVGLGIGTLRPVITLGTAAAAAVTMTAANCSMTNIRLNANFTDVTNAIDVTAAWCSLDYLEFTEAGTNLNFVDYIHASSTTDGTADGLSVTNCVGTAIDAAQNSFILTAADIDRGWMTDNTYISTHANTLAFFLITSPKTVTNLVFLRNNMDAIGKTAGDMLIDGSAADNSGIAAYNTCNHIDTAGVVPIDCQNIALHENYSNSTNATQGVLYPVADTVD